MTWVVLGLIVMVVTAAVIGTCERVAKEKALDDLAKVKGDLTRALQDRSTALTEGGNFRRDRENLEVANAKANEQYNVLKATYEALRRQHGGTAARYHALRKRCRDFYNGLGAAEEFHAEDSTAVSRAARRAAEDALFGTLSENIEAAEKWEADWSLAKGALPGEEVRLHAVFYRKSKPAKDV